HTRWPRDWSSDVCSSDLRVHVHEVVARVGHDAAVPVEAPERAVPDLVDPAGGDAEVLPALGNGRRAVARHVPAVIDFAQDVLGRSEERRVGKEWSLGWGA